MLLLYGEATARILTAGSSVASPNDIYRKYNVEGRDLGRVLTYYRLQPVTTRDLMNTRLIAYTDDPTSRNVHATSLHILHLRVEHATEAVSQGFVLQKESDSYTAGYVFEN